MKTHNHWLNELLEAREFPAPQQAPPKRDPRFAGSPSENLPVSARPPSRWAVGSKHREYDELRHELPFVPIMSPPSRQFSVYLTTTDAQVVYVPDNAVLMSISTVTDLNSGGLLYSIGGLPTLDTSASGAQSEGVGLVLGQGVLMACEGLQSVGIRAVTAGYATIASFQFWDVIT